MGLREYRRYGNAAEQLSQAVKRGHVAHAYLFEGDHNVDKAGFARAFAQAILCPVSPGEGCGECLTCRKIQSGNYEDLYLVEPVGEPEKSNFSIKDQVLEELQANLKMKPTGGPRNIAIIEGADYATARAQNRFLKTLEEPAPGTVIMILSENRENLLPTIQSRCTRFLLSDLSEYETGGPASAWTGADRGTASASGMTEADDGRTVGPAAAEEILQMMQEKRFFYDIKSRLDEILEDKQTAYAFLDGMESVMGRYLRRGDSGFSDEMLIAGIREVEKTRRNVRLNVNFKYAIRELILKLPAGG